MPRQRYCLRRRFLSDLKEGEEDAFKRRNTEARLMFLSNTEYDGEEEQIGMILEEWDCRETTFKVSIAVGDGSYSFAVYCREEESRDSDEEDSNRSKSNGEWRWRSDWYEEMPCQSDLYDTTEEFLDWYAES